MRNHLLALMASLVLVVALGVGTASASTQAADQSAESQQGAHSNATSTQSHPTNTNIAVRIDSPGDNGDVTQTNASDADSLAANANKTAQSLAQGGSGGVQHADQSASNDQDAHSSATSSQDHPKNSNVSVRIDSPGKDGKVDQTNSSKAHSDAKNGNETNQTAEQGQRGGGSCCSDGGVQAADQDNHNDQHATSDATSQQDHPTNRNVSVRIDSEGDNGDVTQTNESIADSVAANHNTTHQNVHQSGGGSGCCGSGVQEVTQSAHNDQDADSSASSTQDRPSNHNHSSRLDSPGSDGKVTQTNGAFAGSLAENHNETDQTADQGQAGGRDGCGCGVGVQALKQKAESHQHARSSATSEQDHPQNTNAPVRIKSPGGGGEVVQSNESMALSLALNGNSTDQRADQHQGGGGGVGVQAAKQWADNSQSAGSHASSHQEHPCNCNAPVRIKSEGDDGTVEQANTSFAGSVAKNDNWTNQSLNQVLPDGCCRPSAPLLEEELPCGGCDDRTERDSCDGCDGIGVQALSQKARNWQDAGSKAESKQDGASNKNAPKRLDSPGGGGSVAQLNAAFADSLGTNHNFLDQDALQAPEEVIV